MKPLLAPLVGQAPTVTFVGLCKNAGKTTALCRLLSELEGESLAITSIGRDGERTDLVTGTEKPQIWVCAGTLFATARGMLPLCDVTTEVLHVTDVSTPLGKVAILRALSDGYVQIAGPSSVAQLSALEHTFRSLGASRVLIDGAAGRKSLAGAGVEGCTILCTGASMDGTMEDIVAETAHICTLFDTPTPSHPLLCAALEAVRTRFALFTLTGEPLPLSTDQSGQPLWGGLPREHCVLWAAGGVTDSMLRTLSQRGAPITLAVPDATHILSGRRVTLSFFRRGGNFLVQRSLTLAALCANPWSARGRHLERAPFLTALREATSLPVIDVKEEAP